MLVRKEFVARELAGEYYLIPIGESAKSCSLIALSDSGAFIWKLLPEAENPAYIVDRLLDEYEIDRETAAADTEEFLGKLMEMEII